MPQRKRRAAKKPRRAKASAQPQLARHLGGLLVALVLVVGAFQLGLIGQVVLGSFQLLGGQSAYFRPGELGGALCRLAPRCSPLLVGAGVVLPGLVVGFACANVCGFTDPQPL